MEQSSIISQAQVSQKGKRLSYQVPETSEHLRRTDTLSATSFNSLWIRRFVSVCYFCVLLANQEGRRHWLKRDKKKAPKLDISTLHLFPAEEQNGSNS